MIRIGKIAATHGLNGALILSHIVGNSKWLKKEHKILVEMHKGSYIPYFISQCKASGDKEYNINIEDINKIEQAKKMVAKHVYVDEAILAGFADKSPLLWIGFKITDKQKGDIGAIEDVVQTGYQWLAKLTYKNSEVLIPLIDSMIEKLDIKARAIKMNLPDGLLEVYS